jgi:hypothetical protein
VSFIVESTGSFALSSATTHNVALSGTALSGCGFALDFQLSEIEALKTVADHNHGLHSAPTRRFSIWRWALQVRLQDSSSESLATRRFSSMAQELRAARVCRLLCSITSLLSRTHVARKC